MVDMPEPAQEQLAAVAVVKHPYEEEPYIYAENMDDDDDDTAEEVAEYLDDEEEDVDANVVAEVD